MPRTIFLIIFILFLSDECLSQKNKPESPEVQLKYDLSDTLKAIFFYNELSIFQQPGIPGTKYIACGFSNGYLGLQVKDKNQVVYSIHNDGVKTKLISKGENVSVEKNMAVWNHKWQADTTYKFLVTALPDSTSNTTTYSGYFFAPELNAWKYIASFRVQNDSKSMEELYSSLGHPKDAYSLHLQKAYFYNGWARDENNKWTELSKSKVVCNNDDNYTRTPGGGVENNRFTLWSAFEATSTSTCNKTLGRDTTGVKPVVNLYHNVDSIIIARKELNIIHKSVKDGVIDTTGSNQGVWYKILKEGTGEHVNITDTVTAFYKGWVLNGAVFDSTKNEPAVFPLNRLIRGWQLGVPMIKAGGKIRLIIPSGLAYSIRNRAFNIPPNSILLFDIEVVSTKQQATQTKNN